ncbi:mechanosensitive ion channel family protein [Alkalilimnicola ehrlichii]|uniref:mechanosensitive ion channel family protein n=1 Tax=Alkalilimnicola ehrlichii TaxID=351052 RepID=UPI003B9FFBE8
MPEYRRLLSLFLLLLTLLLGVAMASLSVAGGPDPEQREPALESLDDVIQTLEDGEQRDALLQDLRRLRAVLGEDQDLLDGHARQGVLGVLGEGLSELREMAQAGEAPIESWSERFEAARDDLGRLFAEAGSGAVGQFLLDAGVFLALWVFTLFLLMGLARLLDRRQDWPLRLPNEARVFLLVVHFTRRVLPWALAFALILGLNQFLSTSPGHAVALVVAYVALLGRLLALAAETVFSLYTRGHRGVAVRILRERSLGLLSAIGALVALADALDSQRVAGFLGPELAELISLLASLAAAILAGAFVVWFKRPVRHLLVNRPYSQRHHWSTADDVLRLLGNVWHIPALVLVGASVLAVLMEAGDPGAAVTRAMISAALLVLTLVVTRLLRRQGERRMTRRRMTLYRERLERFGHTLLHLVIWVAFVELTLQVWGGTLVGLGGKGVAAQLGQTVLAVVVTVLLAWLVWILADTAIQRALTSTARARGRRVNVARVQTVTPMLRNILFSLILVLAAIAVLANLGVNVTPLLAGAGVVGLALGFGAQKLVQDVITGIFILIEDSLAVDDFVEIEGHMGTVEGLTLRTVRLRDLDGVLHIITFSQIQAIHNMSRQFGIALIRVRVPPVMGVDDTIALLREVAADLRRDSFLGFRVWSGLEVQGVERFDEGGAILRVRMRTAPEWQWDVARGFNLRLKRLMEERGIDVAAPRLSVRMESDSGGPGGDDGPGARGPASGDLGQAGGQPSPGDPHP